MNDFDGFEVRLLIDEDGGWIAHFIELPQISAGGRTPEHALAELRIAWAMVKDSYLEECEPIPQPTYRASQAA
jgi:predicted RNase H-like HicB family nuclease